MKKIIDLLISEKTTLILMLIAGISMAVATFIEDKYDTLTARIMVYNAKWYELVFVLLVINMIGIIMKYRLYRKEKLAGFVFHTAFIVMIIGAAVTRYTGFEGSMRIREGQSSNILYSDSPYILVKLNDNGEEKTFEFPVQISSYLENSFSYSFSTESTGPVNIKYKNLVPNAVEVFNENVPEGKNIIELNILTANGVTPVYLYDGEFIQLGSVTLAYNNPTAANAIQITDGNGKLNIVAPFDIKYNEKGRAISDTIFKDSLNTFLKNNIYTMAENVVLFNQFFRSAKKEVISNPSGASGASALILDFEIKGTNQEVAVYGGSSYYARYQPNVIGGMNIDLAYGTKPIELPFSLYLRDFKLDRYAGSMSPSSYESEVTLIDERYNLREDHRIFMNNVLDYEGYRFFQSSYDQDEGGTILSVNHDFAGTWISYTGYFLLTLGFVFALLSKKSRFLWLLRRIVEIENSRKAGITIALLLLGFGSIASAQTGVSKPVSAEHAEKFGKILVQSQSGRFQPANTLAYDVLHKITRQDKFDLPGKGKMNADQVLLDMLVDPEFWKVQEIIYVREKPVREVLGLNNKNAAFRDFFDASNNYKLQNYAEIAFQKKAIDQNKFDKEVIKVDERANIFMLALNGGFLKIFPIEGHPNNKWASANDNESMTILSAQLQIINDDLQLPILNYRNIFHLYISELTKSVNSGDYSRPDKILGYISTIQRQLTPSEIIPTEKMVDVEIHYNESNIFILLRNVYGALSFILLILAFIDILRSKKNKILQFSIKAIIVLLAAAFIYHSYGMILRWYLSGHAPWSNGYEALVLVAWGSILAGFFFVRYIKIALAASGIMAFLMLMTAGHSSYDPQLTNLVPVLKSYWLIIHVATLTISYSFFGASFILGIVNLLINIFRKASNSTRLMEIIKELSYISEVMLAVGIVLATVGTFLGGVWANESWGRYWGWDAKETWALIIVVVYAIVLHLRFVPKLASLYVFNIGAILGFGSVIMTFIGVNYYLSKGMHSYGKGDTPVFPIWAWITILSILALIVIAGIKEHKLKSIK